MTKSVNIFFQVIRIVLIILLAIIFIISTIYFIKAVDAIGDDVEQARETHYGHEIEEVNEPASSGVHHRRFDPYEDYENEDDFYYKHGGRLLTSGHHHYRITNSRYKQQHIISLIVWVVLTLFCAILSLAGILGALFLNPCLVSLLVI